VLLDNKDPKSLELVKANVDELRKYIAEKETKPIYQLMGEQLGIDVKEVFQKYDANNTEDYDFCFSIFKAWQGGTLLSLSTTQIGSMKRHAKPQKSTESMWDKLERDLVKRG
jgi:hypothetical protein